jgi:plastocyanin
MKEKLRFSHHTADTKILFGVILILLVGVAFTVLVTLPHPAGKTLAPSATITILNGSGAGPESLTFSPSVVVVIVGVNNTVEWINNDTVLHSVTSSPGDPASFDSNVNPDGGTFTYQFTQAGTYTYFCRFHSWMHGEVIVESSA